MAAIILFGFTPISRVLLRTVDGSFAPSKYSSLALRTPSDAVNGLFAGQPVLVRLTNHTGHLKTYHWNASQNGALISLGEQTLGNGRATTISVPSRGAISGRLRIAISGTNIFVTVPILAS
ncbi:MAG TPA: hypothetical protein VGZ04_04925 [Acidimicrobiales bacterium]|nr:hypothetical protein [Acidimicrobiales bacterium]